MKWVGLLFLGLVTVFICFAIFFFYYPMRELNSKPHEAKHDVPAFADWDIRGPFNGWSTAKELALLSWLSYYDLDESNLQERCGDSYSFVTGISPTYSSQRCYLIQRQTGTGEKVLIIVFRGSDDFSDWWDNVNCLPCQTGSKKEGLHSGFANRYGHFEYAIREEIKKFDPNQIWITGHSLGGALAVICADQIKNDSELNMYESKLKGVFTFAQPMVGKESFKEFRNVHVHFTNENDIVPRLAPSYKHSGLMIRFKGNDVFLTKGYTPDDPRLAFAESGPESSDLKTSFLETLGDRKKKGLIKEKFLKRDFDYDLPFADDHKISGYFDKIDKAVEGILQETATVEEVEE